MADTTTTTDTTVATDANSANTQSTTTPNTSDGSTQSTVQPTPDSGQTNSTSASFQQAQEADGGAQSTTPSTVSTSTSDPHVHGDSRHVDPVGASANLKHAVAAHNRQREAQANFQPQQDYLKEHPEARNPATVPLDTGVHAEPSETQKQAGQHPGNVDNPSQVARHAGPPPSVESQTIKPMAAQAHLGDQTVQGGHTIRQLLDNKGFNWAKGTIKKQAYHSNNAQRLDKHSLTGLGPMEDVGSTDPALDVPYNPLTATVSYICHDGVNSYYFHPILDRL